MVDALRALAQPVAGSPAVAYLAARALTRLPAEDLGWLPPMPTQVPAGSKIAIRSPQCGALVVWARGRGGNVTGGQRILINGDGTAVVTKVPKPAFGTIGGCPARFAAWRQEGSRPGPLIVAEGSERRFRSGRQPAMKPGRYSEYRAGGRHRSRMTGQ